MPTENLLGRVVGPLGLVVQLDDDDLLTVRRNPERQLGPGGLDRLLRASDAFACVSATLFHGLRPRPARPR